MKNLILTLIVSCAAALVTHAQQTEPTAGQQINVAKHIDPKVVGTPLNFLVNTAYEELGPMPTKDGRRLYFSRQGHPENTGGNNDEDIWFSEFDDATQSWTKAVNLGPPLNNPGPNFVTGVGRTGDTLLLGNVYLKKGRMRAGVSVSIKVGQLWSFPAEVKIEGDYNFSGRASYDLSHDRTTMIIAQEKVDTHGKLDLYVAFKDPDSKYPYTGKESFNMGPVINSHGNETTPWLSYDGRTLYFASDGHNGYGGLDIFMSTRLDNTWTNWSEPVNLGPGINSSYDDMSFNFNPLSRYAYYSRGLTPTNADIYRIDMTFFFVDKNTQLAAVNDNPVQIGETEIVTDAFKDDSSDINQVANKGLDYVADFLKKFPKMLILISTHSNKHESRNESLTLSTKRAVNVVDYLVSHGIPKSQLSFVGLGHDVLVNTPESSQGQGTNIASRVEFKLIGFSKN